MQVKSNALSIKLPTVFKSFILSVFEWPRKTGLTVASFKINDYHHVTEKELTVPLWC